MEQTSDLGQWHPRAAPCLGESGPFALDRGHLSEVKQVPPCSDSHWERGRARDGCTM